MAYVVANIVWYSTKFMTSSWVSRPIGPAITLQWDWSPLVLKHIVIAIAVGDSESRGTAAYYSSCNGKSKTESIGTAAYCISCSRRARLGPLVLRPIAPAVTVWWEWTALLLHPILTVLDSTWVRSIGGMITAGRNWSDRWKICPGVIFFHQKSNVCYTGI